MSRLEATFAALREQGRKALIPFITAGDPFPEFTVPLLHAMVAAGADIIELGVPFSDPMADGPVIQRASERALAQQVGLSKTLSLAKQFRETDQQTPLVLMGYLNPIEMLGYQRFAHEAQTAGIDGVLTVDMPPEEADEYVSYLKGCDIDQIFLLAPNSDAERVKKMDQIGSGYLYYVSLKGVTGAGHLDTEDVARRIAMIKSHTSLPVGVGFGVKDADAARRIAKIADAVVVGSAFISKIEQHPNSPDQAKSEIIELLQSMRLAMDTDNMPERNNELV